MTFLGDFWKLIVYFTRRITPANIPSTGENAYATGLIAHEMPTMKMRKKQGE